MAKRIRRTHMLLALVFAVAAGIALEPATADARPRPAGKHRRSNFEANKSFGLGLMLGAPTGLSGKYFLGRSSALDFGVGTIYEYRHRRGLHIHADYLWHPVSLVSAKPFELPLYFGVGGRLFNGRRCYVYRGNQCDYYYRGYTALGVRGPIGIAFDFNNVPLDIFVELALVLDIVVDHDDAYDDSLYFDVNGAVGIRYYFW